MIEVRNAIIKSATIVNNDHGLLSSWLTLDYGGVQQAFGGWSLYFPEPSLADQNNTAGIWLWRCLEVAGVTEWSQLPGVAIRARCDDDEVYAIGHIIKDIWFELRVEFLALEKSKT